MISKQTARRILQTYGKAWTTKDTDLILSIFTKDGTYHERWYEPPFKGHKGIAKYWNEKVVKGQSGIRFRVINYWIVKDTVIAEWEAWFYNKVKRKDRHIKEVGIFEMKGNKVKSLRELWQKSAK